MKKKKEMAYTPDQAEIVTDYLASVNEPRKIMQLAAVLKISYAETKKIMQAMNDDGLVHRLEFGNEQYKLGGRPKIEPMTAPVHAPPLKVDKHRRELYARLAADRDSIKSIG